MNDADPWISVSRAYALARLVDIRDEAARALRAGSSASMTALTTIARLAAIEIERQRAVDVDTQ
jgi:hypothetical protein